MNETNQKRKLFQLKLGVILTLKCVSIGSYYKINIVVQVDIHILLAIILVTI